MALFDMRNRFVRILAEIERPRRKFLCKSLILLAVQTK
ncbi:hypothetical protein HMPREF1147_1148 [Selenomonas sp. FOBRC9]|nr:hypothetical protein HMPREF1147_1148 [Selenomonas sp. FOBRC9]